MTSLTHHDLQRLFDLSVDVLCVSSGDSTIIGVNPAFLASLGYAEEDLIGKPFYFMIHQDDIQETMTDVSALGRGETTLLFENRIVDGTGETRWFQ